MLIEEYTSSKFTVFAELSANDNVVVNVRIILDGGIA